MLLFWKFPVWLCAFVLICSQKSCSEAAGYKKESLMRRNIVWNISEVQEQTVRPLLIPTIGPLWPSEIPVMPVDKHLGWASEKPLPWSSDKPLPVPVDKQLLVHADKPIVGLQPQEDAINYGNLEISEPGFDFTDEEMQKLKIWPRGVIPYFIDYFSFDKVLRDRLRAFLEHTNTVAGVRFSELSQPPRDDSRWVFFINRRDLLPCADLDIRKFNSTGVQRMVIGYDCMEPGNLAEIVLALVGVPPQHNAPNRDEYVEVQTANILPGKEPLFEKFSDSEWLFHELKYDFSSAGHYGYHKYTANGGATLKPLDAVDLRAGEVTDYSYSDIWKIRMLYNYITRKEDKIDNGACSKLFKPGDKFKDSSNYGDDKEAVQPRSKPSKYTGMSEEKIPQPDNDDDSDNSNKENGSNHSEESKSTGDTDHKKPLASKIRKLKKNKNRKPLAPDMENLSDIQTDK